jgi:peptidyl-prolyl cis-trans isomerase B (cyclophilin B)
MTKMTTKATITMENGGRIVLTLDPKQTPQTVANFKALADKHFYDGLIFHRVISGFMIQGGCPQGTGTGGPGYQIKGEFKANGVNNQIRHERGAIAMARSMQPDSAGSQFFIVHQAAAHLDGQYAAFGCVVEGMEVVDQIAATRTGRQDRPIEDQKIRSIVVEEVAEPSGDEAK